MWRYCGTWYCRPLKFFFTWVFRLMQDSLKNASDYGKLVSLHLHLVPPSSHLVFNSVIFQICDCIQYSYFRKHSIMKNNLVILRWIFVSKKFVLLFTSCIIDRSGFAFYWTIRIFAFFTVFFTSWMKVSFGHSTSLERRPMKSLSSMLLPVRPSEFTQDWIIRFFWYYTWW